MAKHQITINIVSKQSKDEAKRDKLNNATGKSQGASSSTKLQSKQSAKSGKSSSSSSKSNGEGNGASAANKAAVAMTAIKIPNTLASAALNLTSVVGDYTVESARAQSVMNLGSKISSIAINSAASGPLWWATLILELVNWGIEMGENNIQWNHQQQLNTIAAQRASDRLGIVATAGNRNMKL